MKRILLAIAATALVGCNDETSARPDFRAALGAHLAAIDARDLGAYEKTISDDDFYLIFPNGETIAMRDNIVDFHKDWFADSNWRMSSEIVKVIEGEDMATALLKYDYRDAPGGDARPAWLVLVFKLENGEWRLVHDQNTRITLPETPEATESE